LRREGRRSAAARKRPRMDPLYRLCEAQSFHTLFPFYFNLRLCAQFYFV
jgi:hypothetical protein